MKENIRLIIIIFISLFTANIVYAQFSSKPDGIFSDLKSQIPVILTDSLPPDFPTITIDILDNPSPGYIFMENLGISRSVFYLLILDSTGQLHKYYKPPIAGINFKVQPNGLYSFGNPVNIGTDYQAGPLMLLNFNVIEYLADSSFTIIDSVQMQNGYLADFHDFVVLPNGHYLLMNYETNHIDMSRLIPGGNPNAKVIGTVIQELDNNKNCVFQWRSLDHIPILDSKDNLLNASFEHVHGSSFYLDADGNLIVSLVATAEIIKIDMISGKIIWRLGGSNSQFSITGDHEENAPFYFTMQHDVKRLSNGNLLFYDNGFDKKTWYSRAVEYSLDEMNRNASLVWEFRHSPDISGYAMGSAQRLPNGNTLIDWGLIFTGLYKTITEVTPDKKTALELSLPSDAFTYVASKHKLPLCNPVAELTKYELKEGNVYSFNNGESKTGVEILVEKLNAFLYNSLNVKKFDCTPLNIYFDTEAPVLLPCRYLLQSDKISSIDGSISFDFATLPARYNLESLKVYYRHNESSGTFTGINSNYDSNTNQLTAKFNDTGEYVIGFMRIPVEIFPPSLMSPGDKSTLINNSPAKLTWSPTGRYDKFRVQLAEDSLFISLIHDTNGLKQTSIVYNPEPNKTLYWRAKSYYGNLESEWSVIHSFGFSSAFISIDTPNGGEVWYIDSSYNIIRWDTNLPDTVSIELFRNGIFQYIIKDTLLSFTHAFAWKIPKNIPEDSSYKIRVSSLKDSNFYDDSDGFFTIKPAPTLVDDNIDIPGTEIINYPNPSLQKISFRFPVEKTGITSIKIYDMFGRESVVSYEGILPVGVNIINLDVSLLQNGSYIYQIISGTKTFNGKFIIIK